MKDSKTIRGLMVLAFSAAVAIGFSGCEAFDETDDDLDNNIGQIQQHDVDYEIV